MFYKSHVFITYEKNLEKFDAIVTKALDDFS